MKLALTIAAVVATALIAAPPATAADPSRVLIVGDSVSQGYDGDYTWRYFAWQSLAGGPSVDFVGQYRQTHKGAEDPFGGTYADPVFDTDHASRWSGALWQVLEGGSDTIPSIGDLVAAHDPEVIVQALGVNDLAWAGSTAETMEGRLRTYVEQARAVKPGVDVVLAPVPQTWIGDAVAYNAMLPGLAADLSTSASRVTAATAPVFVEGEDTTDYAHPSTQGQRKIAASVVRALGPLLAEPPAPATEPVAAYEPETSPAVATTTTAPVAPAPAAPRRFRAVRKGARVVVSWRAAARAERYAVKCGTRGKVTTATRTALRSQAARCKVRSLGDGGRSAWVAVRVRA